MKKSLSIFIIISTIILLTLFFGIFIREDNYRRIFLAVTLILLSFFLLYLFFGIGKLVSSLIYSIFLAVLLVLLPINFETEIIFIATFVFFLNPLHRLDAYIEKTIGNDKTIIDYLRGTHISYYKYRKDLKEYYHLPQVKKTFTKPYYLMARRVLTIIMAMIAIFLLLREVNNLMNLIKEFKITSFFTSSYSVIVLLVLTIILYRKGFQSMVNFLTVSIFPAVSFYIYSVITIYGLAVLLSMIVLVVGIVVGIFQYYAYRHRINYEYYHYYDQEKLVNVYANALFEPYVYDENFRLTTTFTINTDQIKFSKNLQSIIVFADFNKFFITAYTVSNESVEIFTDFHYKDEKKIVKFKHFLEEMFSKDIKTKMVEDPSKQLYEEVFFHNKDYIISRTIYLANIMKRLEIKSSVIVNLTAYFNDVKYLTEMSKKYFVNRLEHLEDDDVIIANISLRIVNVDYIIENKMHELLLDLLINKGTYIRVSVYY